MPSLVRVLVAACALAALSACSDSSPAAPTGGLSIVSGAPVGAVPGWPLHDTTRIQLADDAGAPLAGVAITWTITKGDGSITVLNGTTDAQGESAVRWTIDATPGVNELTAHAASGATIVLTTIGRAFRAERVASGASLGCGLIAGAAWCWGNNAWVSTAGVSDRPDPTGYDSPTTAPGLLDQRTTFVDVAVTSSDACTLDNTGIVRCASAAAPDLLLVGGVPPLWRIVGAPTATGPSFCGLALSDSTAWCWDASGAAQVPGSPALVSIGTDAFPGGYACGLRTDSTAVCWGAGPLGDGTTSASASPVAVSGGRHFARLAVGSGFACGLTAAGEVWCWGRDWTDGPVAAPDQLVPLRAATGASEIAANDDYAAAVVAGQVVAWFGAGFDATPSAGFTDIGGLDGRTVATFASSGRACLQLTDAQVYCWDEMWDRTSRLLYGSYVAVQPVAGLP